MPKTKQNPQQHTSTSPPATVYEAEPWKRFTTASITDTPAAMTALADSIALSSNTEAARVTAARLASRIAAAMRPLNSRQVDGNGQGDGCEQWQALRPSDLPADILPARNALSSAWRALSAIADGTGTKPDDLRAAARLLASVCKAEPVIVPTQAGPGNIVERLRQLRSAIAESIRQQAQAAAGGLPFNPGTIHIDHLDRIADELRNAGNAIPNPPAGYGADLSAELAYANALLGVAESMIPPGIDEQQQHALACSAADNGESFSHTANKSKTRAMRADRGEIDRLRQKCEKIVRQRNGEMVSINELVKATQGKRSSIAAAIRESPYLLARRETTRNARRKYSSVSAATESTVLSAANAKSGSGRDPMNSFLHIFPDPATNAPQELSQENAAAIRKSLIEACKPSERERYAEQLKNVPDNKILELAALQDDQEIDLKRQQGRRAR